jgi:hypothetical protein
MPIVPEFFAEEIAEVHFMGANTMLTFARSPRGGLMFKPVANGIFPTGSIPGILRQLASFAIEHRLPVPGHIAL